jgi:hypothetical protein
MRKAVGVHVALVVLFAFASYSCTRSTKPDEIVSHHGYRFFFEKDYYVDVEASFDDVWATVISSLGDLEWRIDSQVETAGMIITKEETIGTNRDRYACRSWPGSATRVDEMRCTIAVHVGASEGAATRVRAFANLEGRYLYVSSVGEEKVGGWWPCTSTGEIEGEFFDALLSRLEPLKFVSPVYRKWTAGRPQR